MADHLYAAKNTRGVMVGNVVAESEDDARQFFASGSRGHIDFDAVVRVDHIGPHSPYCPDGCVA